MKRILYLLFTWPYNDRSDYDRWLGAQFPIPAWVLLLFVGAIFWAALGGAR